MLSFVFCFSLTAYGQETTGNIEGTITDPSGARIAGATVELVSQSFRRTVTTNEEGFFRALQLQPGIYTVNATASNFQPFSRENIQVLLGQTTPVNIQLAIGGVGAEVTVTDTDQLAIDPTSSRIQTNLTEQELEQLPRGTNFTSALRAVPSVRPEPSAAGFSIDGATGVENSFIIDGQEVSNFRTGGLNSNNNLPFQLVRELQVKNSGFEAEFGGATGGVINVVTKSGGNDFHGEVGAEFDSSKLRAGQRRLLRADENAFSYINPRRDEGVDFFPSASLSGPIIKDRVWFFASATPQYYSLTRNYTFADGTERSYTRDEQHDYYFARVDAAITDNLRIYSTYTYNPVKVNGIFPLFNTLASLDESIRAGSSVTFPDEEAQRNLGGRNAATNFNINGSFVATPNLVFSARFSRGYLNEGFDFATNSGRYGVPTITRFECITSGNDFGFGCSAGFQNISTNDALTKDISIRKNFDADVSYILDNFGGRHQFKAGYQRFNISNEVETGYVGPGRVRFHFGQTTVSDDGVTFGNRPGEVGYARLIMIGEFGEASSKNESIYVQDSWQPFNNLTLNLGVRIEREDVPSFTPGFEGIQFDFSDKIAPRLGFAWDVLSNGKFKIFANYGQFFDRFKYELPRGSFGGNIFDDYRAPILASQTDIFSYTKDYVLANALSYTNFRVPSNDPNDFRVDPDLKPVRQTEFTVGSQIDLGANTILGARYTHKELNTTIEDIGFHDENDDESYFIGNPGRGVCALAACGRYDVGSEAAKPERKYDALEVVVDKRFSSNFTINANYTFSRLFGNYSGLASTDEYSVNQTSRDSPNVNRFFDTPFDGFNVGGGPNNGRLGTDRPHVFKFFGAYTFNNQDSFLRLPSNNELELSAFFTAQSGTPITTRVDLIDNAYIPLFSRGDLGRTETFTQTDVALAYRYRFGRDNRYGVQFNVDVFNLFNEANTLAQFETLSQHIFDVTDFEPFGVTITDRQDFDRAFFDGRITSDRILTLINNDVKVGVDPKTGEDIFDSVTPDARYGQGQFFQGPRTIRFGFKFMF
jgi:hypothetical protein